MQTINIIAHTENASQIEAVKAFMKALKIKFEISKQKPNLIDKVAEVNDFSIEHKVFLDERLKDHQENPQAGKSWQAVKATIQNKYGV